MVKSSWAHLKKWNFFHLISILSFLSHILQPLTKETAPWLIVFYMYVKPSSESANYIKDNYCFVKSRLQMKKLWNVTCVSVELYDVAHFEEMWGRQFNVTSSSRAADQSSQFASNAFIASRQRVYSSFSTRGSALETLFIHVVHQSCIVTPSWPRDPLKATSLLELFHYNRDAGRHFSFNV